MTKEVALVTGGMGGLGEAISTKLADSGYRVAVTYSPANKSVKQWLEDTQRRGYEFAAYPCDVTNYDSCGACVAAINRDWGPVDILVNNAGITRDASFKKAAAFITGANLAINGGQYMQ